MRSIPEYFGEMVFDYKAMESYLPASAYTAWRRTIEEGKRLDLSLANEIADAMKRWAIERGATHYTHWFQPMTGITAEKHDSFLVPAEDGRVVMEFSGKELVRGEPDASSFPSGGLRATFEARGYTAWDPTSFAFVKGKTLYIPTAFCSYGGEALDKKTPLLRSMQAISKQALRVLRLFGNEDVTSVYTTVGAEQEYFLVDMALFNQRKDLVFTGRTLFGAKPPKGQELDDHYFGAIKPRVAAFMEEVDDQLWRLGVLSKTKHNEAAPGQHELAPMFSTTNIATDHNQLTMEILKTVAERHGMVCLLHEKPFAGVAGSGKHNNWSLSTGAGVNLLSPGETPYENAQFLLFLCAVLQAVDDYQDLLRISVADAGNDHRLGAAEAPTAVVSVFLGDELTAILDAIEHDTAYAAAEKTQLRLGVHVLPKLPRDTTDRNRTSPFAFTGNKFEFRMLGASNSIAGVNIMLNTAVAESLRQYADRLEGAADFNKALHELIRQTIIDHKRIIFNGNGYDEAWIREAVQTRGLSNYPTTPDALPHLLDEKNLRLFETHKVYTEKELRSRYEILSDHYCKLVHIEALTMIEMAKRQILPAVAAYAGNLSASALSKRSFCPAANCAYEEKTVSRLSLLVSALDSEAERLATVLESADRLTSPREHADAYRRSVLPSMEALRRAADEAECLVPESLWPFPTYSKLLFSTN